MKNILSILFVTCIAFVMLVGFYESAYAINDCHSECITGGVCSSSPEKTCNLTAWCQGRPSYYEGITCEDYFFNFCCVDGCPC